MSARVLRILLIGFQLKITDSNRKFPVSIGDTHTDTSTVPQRLSLTLSGNNQKTLKPCTAQEDTVCVCVNGFYCSNERCDHCRPVSNCDPGHGVKVLGGFLLETAKINGHVLPPYLATIKHESLSILQQLAPTTPSALNVKREPTATWQISTRPVEYTPGQTAPPWLLLLLKQREDGSGCNVFKCYWIIHLFSGVSLFRFTHHIHHAYRRPMSTTLLSILLLELGSQMRWL